MKISADVGGHVIFPDTTRQITIQLPMEIIAEPTFTESLRVIRDRLRTCDSSDVFSTLLMIHAYISDGLVR